MDASWRAASRRSDCPVTLRSYVIRRGRYRVPSRWNSFGTAPTHKLPGGDHQLNDDLSAAAKTINPAGR